MTHTRHVTYCSYDTQYPFYLRNHTRENDVHTGQTLSKLDYLVAVFM